MKKKFIIATVVISAITVIVTGCGLKDDTNKTESTTAPVTVETTTMNTENLQQRIEELESEKLKYDRLFNIEVKNVIDKYCQLYLSYSGSQSNNISKLKDYLSDDYYNQLRTTIGHSTYDDNYEQATGLVQLYVSDYEDNGSFNVMAICSQTIIYNDEVSNSNVTYNFNMGYYDNICKIRSVEKIF